MLAFYGKIPEQKRCIIVNFGKKSRFLFTLLQFLDEKHRTAIDLLFIHKAGEVLFFISYSVPTPR